MFNKLITSCIIFVCLTSCASSDYSYQIKSNQRKQLVFNDKGQMVDNTNGTISSDYPVVSSVSADNIAITFNNEITTDSAILDNNISQSNGSVAYQEYVMIAIKTSNFYNKLVVLANTSNVVAAAYVSDDINIPPLFIDPKSNGIKADIQTYFRKTNWTANLSIPYSLLGGKSSNYKFNVVRQLSLVNHNINNQWKCLASDCKVYTLAPVSGYQLINPFAIDAYASLSID